MLKIKNKRLLKAVFSVFMVVVICLATMGSVPIKVYSAYIDPALEKVLSRAADTDLIPVDIWLYEIDTEAVDVKVKAKTGLSKASLANEKTAAELTHAEVDAYIEAERTLYAEAQTKRSNEFLKQYSNIFTSKATENSEIFYVSKYAPSIQMELTPAQIAKLAKDLSVESIYYLPKSTAVNSSTTAIETTRANYTRDTLGYNGSGLRIGMIEGGMPDKTLSFFNSSKIIYDPTYANDTVTTLDEIEDMNHATLVASIMVGQETTVGTNTYEGVVPEATLYSSKSKVVNNNVQWRPGMEWLLSQYVSVINMSFTIIYSNSYTDTYNSEDRWLEHIAINHSVHIVVAAGNYHKNKNPNSYIGTFAKAYNVITVGNLNDNDTSSYNDDSIWHESSFFEGNSTPYIIRKPDLVAPGTNIATSQISGTGTSFAAPLVAGIVAQLCQAKPALKTQQDAMKAILTASINHSVHHYEPSDANYDKYGAGVVDARSALYTASNSRYASSNFSSTAADGTCHYYTFNVTSSDSKIRVSLAWLKYASIAGSNHENSLLTEYNPADLDLRVYNSAGTVQYVSNDAVGNVEIVEMTSLSPGTYTIEVKMYENFRGKVYYTVAWW